MKRAPDPHTPDMFAVPVPHSPRPGALYFGLQLRTLLSDQLKSTPLKRFEVAALMSELTGQEITKGQLDSWTAESRDGWRFPLEYLPALEVALGTHALTAWIAEVRGARLLIGREALEAELGKVARMRQDLAAQEKQLKQMLQVRT